MDHSKTSPFQTKFNFPPVFTTRRTENHWSNIDAAMKLTKHILVLHITSYRPMGLVM